MEMLRATTERLRETSWQEDRSEERVVERRRLLLVD